MKYSVLLIAFLTPAVCTPAQASDIDIDALDIIDIDQELAKCVRQYQDRARRDCIHTLARSLRLRGRDEPLQQHAAEEIFNDQLIGQETQTANSAPAPQEPE